MKLYLAGPMTGSPSFNFPLFYKVTAELRAQGIEIISPAELDQQLGIADAAMASKDGALDAQGKAAGHTWGDLLARDVKIVADEVDGIVFLPNWQLSKGAKLEAFVALLAKKGIFLEYTKDGVLQSVSRGYVWSAIQENL